MPRLLVTKMHLQVDESGMRVEVFGDIARRLMRSSLDDKMVAFHAVFYGVSSFNLAKISKMPFEITGFVIDDIAGYGLEESNYRVCDYESGSLSFDCKRYEVFHPAGFDLS